MSDESQTSQSHPVPNNENLHQFQRIPLKKSRTWFTPDVVLLSGPDNERYVLKDSSARPAWVRRVWCRGALAREMRAYQKLDLLTGVPHVVSVISPDAFIMSFIDGKPLPRRNAADTFPPGFFDELKQMIDEMHRLGVVHGDLRRKNMLIGTDGKPCIIDFETALTDSTNAVQHGVFETIARVDSITVLKIKARYFPTQLTDAEQRILGNAPLHLRLGRFIRRYVYGSLSPKQIRRRLRKKTGNSD